MLPYPRKCTLHFSLFIFHEFSKTPLRVVQYNNTTGRVERRESLSLVMRESQQWGRVGELRAWEVPALTSVPVTAKVVRLTAN